MYFRPPPQTPELSSIEVTSLPAKRNYTVGEVFDPAGMVVTAIYDNGESSVITDYDYSPSGVLTINDTIVTVTYLNKTAEFKIVVTEKVVSRIEVTTAPTKRVYVEGQAFDPKGMVITATYNDASTVVVSDYTLSTNAAALSTSDTKVTVTYAEKTVTVDVTVEAKAVTGIVVTTEPAKKVYIEGQAFDPAGMVITATYNDGETAAVLDYALSANAAELSTSDTQVTVTYAGKAATVGITVEAKVVTGIVVTTAPTKTAYIEGQAFDPAGMVITATYNDGDSKVIPLKEGEDDGYTVSPTALALTDTKVTVSYAGKTATVEVSVEAKVVTSIAITTPPTAVIYINGTNFDPEGMVITATYNDGDSKVIPLKEGDADGYTYTPNGALTMDMTGVEIAYAGMTVTQAVTVSKDIVSISVTTAPTKTAYIEGQAFDTAGMVVSVLYTDNTSEAVTVYTLSANAEELALGDTEVIITYLGQTAKVTVTVAEKTMTGISITTNPSKTKYVVGQAFDPAGMVISAVYDNGKSEVVPPKNGDADGYTFSPTAALSLTDTKVTVSYNGKTAKVNIAVEAKAVTSITVTTEPTKKSYIEGQEFDPKGMVITATYNDGDSKVIPLKDGDADGYTFSPNELAVTDTKVTVTYDGKSADVTVSVIAKVLERITVTTAPSKTAYVEGQTFDPTGMVITAVYDNGKTEIIPLKDGDADGYTFSPNALSLGDSQVTVSYAGKIVTVIVTVEAKVVTGLTVTTNPAITEYIEGQAFDPTGMVITATYNDGENKVIPLKDGESDGYTFAPAELSVTDTKVTVTYDGKTADVTVTVIAKVVTSLTVTKQPTKLVYLDGQTFDPAGMIVTAAYNDGSSVAVTDYSIDTTTPLVSSESVVSVAVTFGEKSANVEVQVGTVQSISIKTEPISVLYVTGEKFDSFGMVVVANLSCGAEYVLSYGDGGYSYTPTDELTKDVTKVTVSYGSFNAEQAITAKDGISVEAEDATVVSSSVKFLTDSPTASGGKYLGELRIGDELIGKFNASAAGTATVVFRAASGYILAKNDSWQPTKMGDVQLNKVADITINGVKITIADDIVLEGGTSETGNAALWFNWTSVRFSDVPVKEGLNLLSFKFKNNDLTTCYGNPTTGNIDGFRIAFDDGITGEAVLASVAEVKSADELASIVAGKTKTTVEAEYGKFGGSTKTEGNGSLSGGFGVGGLEQLTLKVNYAETQENAVFELVAAPAWWTEGTGGNTAMKLIDHIGLTVNGEFCHFGNLEIMPENKDSWWTLYSIVLSGVNLKAGENIIYIEKRTGGINIDCVNIYTGISGTIPSYNASLKGESESVVGTKTTLQAENGTLIDGTKLDGAGVGSLEALTLKVKYFAAQENATFVLAAAPAWWTQEVNGSTPMCNLNQHILMTINGVRVNFTDFTLTPESSDPWWTMYYIKTSGVVLDEGENVIHIRKLWGGLNIDCLDIFADSAGEEIVAKKD